MSRIVLVRHGETVWHGENRYAGRSDIPLTSKGEAQAQMLARWARDADLSAVWSSTLSRAHLTATPAAVASGLPLEMDGRLVELDFGRGEGLTDAEMKAQFPKERARFTIDPVMHHLPGGEDPIAAASRGIAALRAIAKDNEHGRALVVAHNTLMRLVLCQLLGIPLARYRATFPKLANGTLTEIDFRENSIALLLFNAPLHEHL